MCNATAHRLPTHHNNRILYAVNISVSRSWWWAKYCPKYVELILYINKSLLHLDGSSILFYVIDDVRTNKKQVYLLQFVVDNSLSKAHTVPRHTKHLADFDFEFSTPFSLKHWFVSFQLMKSLIKYPNCNCLVNDINDVNAGCPLRLSNCGPWSVTPSHFRRPWFWCWLPWEPLRTRVGTLIVATMYLQLIQNRYMFRSFTVLQCSHQHCVQPVASDVEVVGYL